MNTCKEAVPIANTISEGIVKDDVLSKQYFTKPEITNYITIFDYDDTFLPSSWISHLLQINAPVTNEIRNQLELVDRSATALLQEALQYSKVIIITNAENGWVEDSSRIFMPHFYSLLDDVKVVSARSMYESSYPCCSTIWKKQAFRDEIDSLLSFNDYPSILSIGDSLHEREAVMAYGHENPNSLVKSIKLIEVPSPSHLATQQDLIRNNLHTMIYSTDKLDYKLSIQSNA